MSRRRAPSTSTSTKPSYWGYRARRSLTLALSARAAAATAVTMEAEAKTLNLAVSLQRIPRRPVLNLQRTLSLQKTQNPLKILVHLKTPRKIPNHPRIRNHPKIPALPRTPVHLTLSLPRTPIQEASHPRCPRSPRSPSALLQDPAVTLQRTQVHLKHSHPKTQTHLVILAETHQRTLDLKTPSHLRTLSRRRILSLPRTPSLLNLGDLLTFEQARALSNGPGGRPNVNACFTPVQACHKRQRLQEVLATRCKSHCVGPLWQAPFDTLLFTLCPSRCLWSIYSLLLPRTAGVLQITFQTKLLLLFTPVGLCHRAVCLLQAVTDRDQ